MSERTGPGRPLAEAGNPRNKRVEVRTTADRKAAWQRAARLQGVKLTAWIEGLLDAEAARVIAEAEG